MILREVNINEPAFVPTSYVSEQINCESSSRISYSVYCSESSTLLVEFSVDDSYQTVHSLTEALVGGNTVNISFPVQFKFAVFKVNSIASSPSDLKIQTFFFA